jgi:hypothetical protein
MASSETSKFIHVSQDIVFLVASLSYTFYSCNPLAAFVAVLKLDYSVAPFDFESAEVVEKDDTWGGGLLSTKHLDCR